MDYMLIPKYRKIQLLNWKNKFFLHRKKVGVHDLLDLGNHKDIKTFMR